MGIMTPEEGMQAIENGRLPLNDESIESQKEFKKLKDEGLYEPMVGGPNTQLELADKQAEIQIEMQDKNIKSQEKMGEQKIKESQKNISSPEQKKNNGPAGRPGGTNSPQTTKEVKPMGAKYTQSGKPYKSYNFLLTKVKDGFIKADKVCKKIETSLKRKHKIKELSEEQKAIAFDITKVIVANEEPDVWDKKVKEYVTNPIDTNPDRVKEIQAIAAEHQVDDYLASILYISKE
jgi:hypothetical protein